MIGARGAEPGKRLCLIFLRPFSSSEANGDASPTPAAAAHACPTCLLSRRESTTRTLRSPMTWPTRDYAQCGFVLVVSPIGQDADLPSSRSSTGCWRRTIRWPRDLEPDELPAALAPKPLQSFGLTIGPIAAADPHERARTAAYASLQQYRTELRAALHVSPRGHSTISIPPNAASRRIGQAGFSMASPERARAAELERTSGITGVLLRRRSAL